MCPHDEGSDRPIAAKTINGIHFSNYIYHFPPGNSSPLFCSLGCAVTYGFAVSDATVPAKTISGVCLGDEAQSLARGGSQREQEQGEGDLMSGRSRLWRKG